LNFVNVNNLKDITDCLFNMHNSINVSSITILSIRLASVIHIYCFKFNDVIVLLYVSTGGEESNTHNPDMD